MYKFSEKSEQKLQTCHADLQAVMRAAIPITNFIVIDGARDEAAQNAAFAAGKSKLRFSQSKHNQTPSLAVDIAPFPLDWGNSARFYFLAGVIIATAAQMQIALRWGGDWNNNGEIADNKFNDLVHFELV